MYIFYDAFHSVLGKINEPGCSRDHHCQGGALCIDGTCRCPTGYKSVSHDSKCAKDGGKLDWGFSLEKRQDYEWAQRKEGSPNRTKRWLIALFALVGVGLSLCGFIHNQEALEIHYPATISLIIAGQPHSNKRGARCSLYKWKLGKLLGLLQAKGIRGTCIHYFINDID